MKIIAAMCLILLTGCVQFDHQWSTENRRAETVYQVAHAVDFMQTMQIPNHPNLRETNVFLGDHPSQGKIWVWYVSTAYGHTMMTDLLDQHAPQWVCRTWHALTIGDTLNAVYGNYKLGLKVGF